MNHWRKAGNWGVMYTTTRFVKTNYTVILWSIAQTASLFCYSIVLCLSNARTFTSCTKIVQELTCTIWIFTVPEIPLIKYESVPYPPISPLKFCIRSRQGCGKGLVIHSFGGHGSLSRPHFKTQTELLPDSCMASQRTVSKTALESSPDNYVRWVCSGYTSWCQQLCPFRPALHYVNNCTGPSGSQRPPYNKKLAWVKRLTSSPIYIHFAFNKETDTNLLDKKAAKLAA